MKQENEKAPLFIQLDKQRIRISTIKKYADSGEKTLTIWYGVSRYKVESETFTFPDFIEKEKHIQFLDYWLIQWK